MICLILLIMLSCQSTNYYEVAGIKNELFTKRDGNYINDFVNNRAINRAINLVYEEQEKDKKIGKSVGRSDRGQLEGYHKEKGGENMESDFNALLTTVTSGIAGLYCAIKAIIAFIRKIKGTK